MSFEYSKSESIRNTYKLLIRIIEDPNSVKDLDISCFTDQKRFAQLNLPKEKIIPMSLNSWKAYADEIMPIGWKELDKLRKKALQSIIKKNEQKELSRGSKKDLQRRLDESDYLAQSYLNEIVRFSEQYKHLLEICHIQARNDADFAGLFSGHLKRYANIDVTLSVINGKKTKDE